MDIDRLRDNLASVRGQIADAARRAGRAPDAVRLVAVTKRCPLDVARALVALGQHDLGENYPQELWRKADALAGTPARWHLIGHLQSNKARRTYPLVRLVHSVDSLKLLRLLDELAAATHDPAQVYLQVNCSGEVSKHGWTPEGLLADAEVVASCGRIPIKGLMTMAALDAPAEAARPAFRLLRETRDRLRERAGMPLPELSMGMSNDYRVAVDEGATLVRIGSALFEGVGS
jgi:pyridoxal phosphate enzyme (YggS family)